MKLQIHHIELCVRDSDRILHIFRNQFQFQIVGRRLTPICEQTVVQAGKKIFVITRRRESAQSLPSDEHWTVFCCNQRDPHQPHKTDSVFNIAIQVANLRSVLQHLKATRDCVLLRDYTTATAENSEGFVHYAILKSSCGNIVHTLIEKASYRGGFLPGFEWVGAGNSDSTVCRLGLTSHFDHVAIACEAGDTEDCLDWYGRAFGMRRFLTNREESLENGLMIGGEVGMRLKVMEFWRCSEIGLISCENDDAECSEMWEPLKLVIVESLPNTSNTQIDVFIREHQGPGIQHIGLYTSDIFSTVEKMIANGVRFRSPPSAYYTHIGQLAAIEEVGENLESLQKCGILLDAEADANDNTSENRYLMQIFTFPIFDQDSFFLEIIQRKGAQGFGVGNVTALARSINATNLMKIAS